MCTAFQVLLDLLADCLVGVVPEPATCVQLRGALLSLQDIYRPANLAETLAAADVDVSGGRMRMPCLCSHMHLGFMCAVPTRLIHV